MARQSTLLPFNRAPKPKEQRFNVAQPFATHFRPSCRDYECAEYLNGYAVMVPAGSEHEQFIRACIAGGWPDGLRRHCTEERAGDGLISFVFEPGQPCLQAAAHWGVTRPPVWSHDQGERRRVLQPWQFMEVMNEESDKIARARERG